MTDQPKSTGLTVITSAPLTVSQTLTDFLRDTQKGSTGLEGLTKEDFKIPEIKLMQGQSPEMLAYGDVAKVGEFFHTGMMKSLGKSFRSVVCVVKKRVILWRPKTDQGGGILAISDDSVNWKSGANQTFSVMRKGAKKPVIWKTGPNVIASGLLNFGSADPEDEKSPPAAIEYFEYIHY